MINNKLENSERVDKTKLNVSKNDIAYKNEKIKQIKINNKHIEKVNYFHILKSYFCFKDKKTVMINLCNDIIIEDMSIERILERFYNLEKLNHHNLNIKKEKLKINKSENKFIKDIDNTNMKDLKNEKILRKNKKTSPMGGACSIIVHAAIHCIGPNNKALLCVWKQHTLCSVWR